MPCSTRRRTRKRLHSPVVVAVRLFPRCLLFLEIKGDFFVVVGDITQIDLISERESGLRDALKKLKKIDDIGIIELEESDVDKIRDGSIAEELKFVNHGLRSKLDDVKRKEVDRLR